MNVFEAAIKRIEFLFREFEYLYVSFSGGKDSGVLLELTYMVARQLKRRFGIYHMDYEAQYQLTTDYVAEVLSRYKDIADVYHICVPFKVTTCTSMHQTFWRPWDDLYRDIWVREMPSGAIKKEDVPFYDERMWDYDFQRQFGEWLAGKYGKVCCLVGIRTDESLNRWRSVHSDRNYKVYKGKKWTNTAKNCVNAYPIYDWSVEDIWAANAKNSWRYNELYDLFYVAGVPLAKQRVASPFISEGQETLRLYQVIEPDTWGKLVGRVNGVNFAGLYGGTTAMGWQKITKPEHLTWKEYMYFLLDTLPEETRQGYINKLEVSVKFWRERGGCLDKETIGRLLDMGVDIDVSESSNYNTNKKPVKMEYLEDYEGKNFKDIPTYKRMCVCIIKNDHLCKYMGFSLSRDEMERRKKIQEKYKNIL